VEAARAAAGRMPRAEVAVIPEAGHALPLEAPEALAALLTSFIAAHRRQTLSPTRAHNPTKEGEEAC
jgi:hypothetical protein